MMKIVLALFVVILTSGCADDQRTANNETAVIDPRLSGPISISPEFTVDETIEIEAGLEEWFVALPQTRREVVIGDTDSYNHIYLTDEPRIDLGGGKSITATADEFEIRIWPGSSTGLRDIIRHEMIHFISDCPHSTDGASTHPFIQKDGCISQVDLDIVCASRGDCEEVTPNCE